MIQGPTAVGKTAFSINAAKELNGEIISGDSVQVYRGFDIGSGKIKEEEKEGITHHLIDIRDPKEDYSIYDFQNDARKLIDDISERGKLPMIVGGSGLYLKSALYDYDFTKEDSKDEDHDDMTNEDLYGYLKKVDPKALDKIHINNRRRLLRAYNYYLKTGEPFSQKAEKQRHEAIYDVLFIGLTLDRELLYQKIDQRVDMMIGEGLYEEVEGLLEKGVTFKDKPMMAIGYKEWEPYINKEKTREEVIHDIKKATRNFAKRQYTWFNHQTPITWYDVSDKDKAIKDIKDWLYE